VRPRDLLDPEVAEAIEIIPFDDMDAEVLPTLRGSIELPVSDTVELGWRSYLGDLYGGDVPYTAASARATDLSDLPPAFVSVGAVDGFRDEDVDYAVRLNHAGVPTELHVYPGGCHGFQLASEAPITKQCLANVEGWLARQLRHGGPA
jgi:acetyl esterase/lipase